jgi:hypothetical protein
MRDEDFEVSPGATECMALIDLHHCFMKYREHLSRSCNDCIKVYIKGLKL